MENKSQSESLRSFGFIVGGCFALIAMLSFIKDETSVKIWALWIAFFFFGTALVKPSTLLKPYQIWMQIGNILGWLNIRIVLGTLFFIFITPFGIIKRLILPSPILIKWKQNKNSYLLEPDSSHQIDMSHQF